MANTTSGTVTFDKTFAVDEIIAEAYERRFTSNFWISTKNSKTFFKYNVSRMG